MTTDRASSIRTFDAVASGIAHFGIEQGDALPAVSFGALIVTMAGALDVAPTVLSRAVQGWMHALDTGCV